MIKPVFVTLTSLVLLALTLACSVVTGSLGGRVVRGSGNVVSEEREIGTIDGVQLATVGTLTIEVGEDEALRIEAEDNVLPYIRTQVRGGTLVIDTEPGTNLRSTEPIAYYLTVEELSSIRLSSSGDVVAPDLEADRFEIALSSSGDLDMGELTCETCLITLSSSGDLNLDAVYTPDLVVRISSSGNVTIDDGDVEHQEIDVTSSGNYEARDVDSETADVQLSSSGNARIRVSERLDARLSSSGDLTYHGDPQVDASTSSSGRVRSGD